MAKAALKKNAESYQQIVVQFQQLRQEQQAMVAKIGELEGETEEHDVVIDTLKEVDPSRKCFRSVGGILVERTVGEVLPALQTNREQIGLVLEKLKQQLEEKGQELTEFKEKYNIRVQGEDEEPKKSTAKKIEKTAGTGVLVAK